MFFIALLLILIAIAAAIVSSNFANEKEKVTAKLASFACAIIGVCVFLSQCFITVEPGHVRVATFFGEVQDVTYGPGWHFTNPLYEFRSYDVRDQSLQETAGIPSQDKLVTEFDFSLQYKINTALTPTILNEVGTAQDLVNKHVIPKFRSTIREYGKTVERADDFFSETVQVRLQTDIQNALIEYLQPLGVDVRAVLIRDVRLPTVLVKAVEAKKQREVEVERQQAELDRVRIEHQQKVAQAEAELEAAKLDAEKQKTLAEAQAFEITKINEAIASNPAYIQLQALKALESISSSPSSKIYFLNGDSPTPLPLMHIGDAENIK